MRVVGTDDSRVTIESTVHSGLRGPSHYELVGNDHLVIRSSCPMSVLVPSCSVDYVVHVPREVDVVAHSNGSDVDVTGLTGDADVTTNGGQIHLVFAAAPDHVKAASNGGRVVVEVPDDATFYRVEADSNGGSTNVEVRSDPTSSRLIDAHTNGGEVIVRYAGD